MRPLVSSDIRADLVSNGPVLLIDVSSLPIPRFISHLNYGNLISKLPLEIWRQIIDEHAKLIHPKYWCVRPKAIQESQHGKTLFCQGVTFNLDLADQFSVADAEDFLTSTVGFQQGRNDQINEIGNLKNDAPPRSPDRNDYTDEASDSEDGTFEAEDTKDRYCIFMPNEEGPMVLPFRPSNYADITVPDWIAFCDNGDCWVCEGERRMCPGCTGGKYQKFDCFGSCGSGLACPLCIGMQFAWDDKDFLETYNHPYAPPKKELVARFARLNRRLEEFGYGRWEPDMASLKDLKDAGETWVKEYK
ncbi:uncharacterized protein KY384_000102 [Bacidia gigantensis]|uniref:uncharacterized protein n=1 Tax=Bacidia gigantensis TaxID=2732470 RepID=UPI001D0599A4|nr:uncharacterized protein KY384_000102 [Bacidia gigantensis]KAG8526109.1 hypothetical protein KY384_000102 [Bacidia gigantensis]